MPLVPIVENEARKDFRENIEAALSDLSLIVENQDTLSDAQVRQAISKLVLYMKKLIKYAVATRIG